MISDYRLFLLQAAVAMMQAGTIFLIGKIAFMQYENYKYWRNKQ